MSLIALRLVLGGLWRRLAAIPWRVWIAIAGLALLAILHADARHWRKLAEHRQAIIVAMKQPI